nr:pilus assembly protein [Planctomycetota bacterium]
MRRSQNDNPQSEPAKKRRSRQGFLSAELVFTLPILGLVLFGLFEFSMLFFARGQLAEATRVGCRKAP